MNVLYFFIATALFWEVALSDTSTNSSKFEAFIYDRCKRNSINLATYDEVKTYLRDFTDYLRVAFSHVPDGSQQFCEEDKTILTKAAQVLAKNVRECFPSEEKYLPKFMYESFVQVLNFLCDKNGANVKSIFSTFGSECMQQLKQNNAGTEVNHCFSKVIPPLDGKVRKERLCEDISIAKRCFGTAITKNCPDLPAFQKLNGQFFEAIQKQCDGASHLAISSILLLVAVLNSVKSYF